MNHDVNFHWPCILKICAILFICGSIFFTIPSVYGDTSAKKTEISLITFKLIDTEQYIIERVSLMKAGEFYQDGQSHIYQNISYNKESGEIQWNPCNDNSCSIVSLPTSGGKTGRDELILEILLINPSVNVDSCYGESACERLKGGTRTISGMIEGFFHTGKKYELSVTSLKPGIGESFHVTEVVE